jgi:MATE family multidrug resistance protein
MNKTSENKTQRPYETTLTYLLSLAGPMILTTISFTLMQFVDRYMVSRLGTDALAAILPAGVVCFLPASFAIGVIASVNTYVSQSLGRREFRECSAFCWQSIFMGLVYFLAVIAILFPAAGLVFRFLGHEPSVIDLEVTYVRIVLFAQLPAVFVWSIDQFFMGTHRPKVVMYSAITGQLINLTFNYLLIFGKFGFPKLGIAGAAWGTFIGIFCGACIRTSVFLGAKNNLFYFSRRSFGIEFEKMVKLLKVGIPAGMELMINAALWGMILFWLVGKSGKQALAATNAVLACIHIAIMPVVGIKITLSAAVGKSIGAGKKQIAIEQTRTCLKIALGYALIAGTILAVFRSPIMHFWSSDNVVIAIGTNIIILAVVYQLFDAVRNVYSGVLRGAGDTLWLAAFSGIGMVVILGAGGAVLGMLLPELKATTPWIAAVMSIMTVAIANHWRFRSRKWMKIDLFKTQPVPTPSETEHLPE